MPISPIRYFSSGTPEYGFFRVSGHGDVTRVEMDGSERQSHIPFEYCEYKVRLGDWREHSEERIKLVLARREERAEWLRRIKAMTAI